MYEVTYGIFNHVGASVKRPLSSVALHECEENAVSSSLYESIDIFLNTGIRDAFGLSLTEYLALPTEICIKLTEAASRESSKKSTILSEIESSMKQPKNR